MTAPLLTVCVPTYNRKAYTQNLLAYLCNFFTQQPQYNVEIVLSNNQSTDGTDKIKASYRQKNFTWVEQKTFSPNAEAHLIQCLKFCRGEYVWFIGDDDYPQLAQFPWLYKQLRKKRFDYFLINSPLINSNGKIINHEIIQADKEVVPCLCSNL